MTTSLLILVPTDLEARALFDGGRAPAAEDVETLAIGGRPVRAALCGFGPAAAGALAALALAKERPRACLLVGVAGSYDLARLPSGGLFAPRQVCFADLAAAGFPQAPAAPGRAAVADVLDLAAPPGSSLTPPALPDGLLVTVARPSGSPEEARGRARAHPGALGEDMEGFAVALAAQRLGVPLAVIRSASNASGVLDRRRWDVPKALASLRDWLTAQPL